MQSVALLLLRLSFGLGIAVHGYVPLFVHTEGMEGMTQLIASYEWPAPSAWAYLAKITELVGGLLIAIGLVTRAASLACAFTMGVGIYMAHWPGPFMASENGYELALLYGTVFIALVLMGGGKLSLDALRLRPDQDAEAGNTNAPVSGGDPWVAYGPTPHGAGALVAASAANQEAAANEPVTGTAAVWDEGDDEGAKSDGSAKA